MIQRIQSLFWLLSSVASGLLIFNPTVRISNDGGDAALLYGKALVSETNMDVLIGATPLLSLIVIITLIPLITIFLYKKRTLQMRLTVYNMILMIGLLGLGYYYVNLGLKDLDGNMEFLFYSLMPVVSFILSFLAWRGVRKDYLMLKAVERIR